jgi:cytochrome c-type biogenesis protein CcmH
MGMAFWIIIPLMTLLAISFVAIPLFRKRAAGAEGGASPVTAGPRDSRNLLWLALGLGLVIAIPSVGLYAFVGRPDLAAVRPPGGNIPAPQGSPSAQAPSMDRMIADLEAKTRQTPKDADAWQALGWAYMHLSRFGDAMGAYKHAVSLNPADNESLSALAEATVQANGGKISPAALTGFRRVLSATPSDPRARFYLALFKDQQGDHRGAVADWIKLLKTAPSDASWTEEVRGVTEQVAHEQGLDISSQLPAAPVAAAQSAGPAPQPGPDAVQMAAAAQMSDSDRNAMIHSMVEKLAVQLKQNPADADGWLRLIRARMVLGEKTQAVAAYRDARKAFANAPAELSVLDNAAHGLGVSGR